MYKDIRRISTRRRAKRAAVFAVIALLCVFLAGCGRSKVETSIINAGFDSVNSSTGVPYGWTSYMYDTQKGSVGYADDASRGGVAHVVATGDNDVRLYQTISVAPETVYTISCYVKTSGVSGGAGANIGVYGVAVSSQGVYGDSDWKLLEFTGKTAEGQKELALSVGIGSHGAVSSGEAWFDNISVIPAYEGKNADVLLGSDSSSSARTDSGKELNAFPTAGLLQWTAISTALLVLLWAIHVYYGRKPLKATKGSTAWVVVAVLVAALAVRIILALLINGHKTDINCFVFWGKRVAENGPAEFYGKLVTENGVTVFKENWCDYPPGYMLVLGLFCKIGSWLKLPVGSYSLLVKIPCIIADLVGAYLVYAYSKSRMSRKAAIALMAVAAFTPVVAYVSSAWGQIDQVLSLLIVIPILLLYDRKPVWAGVVYGAAIIVKPQALMAGPLFAAAYILYVIKGSPYKKASLNKGVARIIKAKKDDFKLRFLETALAVLGAFAVIILVSLPFKGAQPWYWLVSKYYGTATSYDYATVNAYNFWAFIGANWKSTDTPFLGLTYGKWGTIFMAVSVIGSVACYVIAVLRHQNVKGALPLTMALMFSGIFTFGHYMHERYIFPALLLLMFAYIFYNDRRILWTYVAYATTMLVNCIAAFYYAELMDVYKETYDRTVIFNETIIKLCSAASILVFIWLLYVTLHLVLTNRPWRGYNGK